jgi:lipid II:glycine glycyltransferase (peptidoglycan interpeptide bridge formation enzyme)
MRMNFGCRSLDLMGIPPDDRPGHPMHGLYRFKTRFGGSIRHRRGCWDYPLEEALYPALAFVGDTTNPLNHG